MDKITIIGAGNMGASLITGLIANQFPANNIWVTDPDEQKLKVLQEKLGVHVTTDNQYAVQIANVVILAVKPQIIKTVTQEIAAAAQKKKPLFISVAAGIRIASLQQWLGEQIAIVRTMPNTPALIRAGATALYGNSFVTTAQHALAESIMRAVGLIVWLQKEDDMDAVTALSGSGPAYFFLVIEAMQAAGEKLGLAPEVVRLLTLQTACGATRMALESNEPAAELRQRVTSPGGTTAAALQVLENAGIRDTFNQALTAACLRSKELSKES